MADPAITGAIVGAVLTAVLTPFIPWIVSKVPFLRNWFLDEKHPLRLVGGVSSLCAASTAFITALLLTSLGGKDASGRIKFEVDPKAVNIPAAGTITNDFEHDRVCFFNKIIKDGGTVGVGTAAGSLELTPKDDRWESVQTSALHGWVTCLKATIVR